MVAQIGLVGLGQLFDGLDGSGHITLTHDTSQLKAVDAKIQRVFPVSYICVIVWCLCSLIILDSLSVIAVVKTLQFGQREIVNRVFHRIAYELLYVLS